MQWNFTLKLCLQEQPTVTDILWSKSKSGRLKGHFFVQALKTSAMTIQGNQIFFVFSVLTLPLYNSFVD